MKKLIIIALAIFATASVQADTVGYTNSTSLTSGQSDNFTLSKFDTALGDLTGVYIEYWTEFLNVRVQLDNDSDAIQENQTASFNCAITNFTSSASMFDGSSDAISIANLQIIENQSYTLQANDGDTNTAFNVGGTDYADWDPGTLNNSGDGNISSFVFSDYEGTGNYTVTLDTVIIAGGSVSDGFMEAQSGSGSFNGRVIYTYTPIPEPATASMMMLVAGLGFLLRRHFVA